MPRYRHREGLLVIANAQISPTGMPHRTVTYTCYDALHCKYSQLHTRHVRYSNEVKFCAVCQVCASAIADLSHLETSSAAFKASAAVLQTITDEQEQSAFHSLLPQMLQVRNCLDKEPCGGCWLDHEGSPRTPCDVALLCLSDRLWTRVFTPLELEADVTLLATVSFLDSCIPHSHKTLFLLTTIELHTEY